MSCGTYPLTNPNNMRNLTKNYCQVGNVTTSIKVILTQNYISRFSRNVLEMTT